MRGLYLACNGIGDEGASHLAQVRGGMRGKRLTPGPHIQSHTLTLMPSPAEDASSLCSLLPSPASPLQALACTLLPPVPPSRL